ncbi:hypothetical protein ACFV4T_22100 [Streptomyces sp. NPDC059755]|uniref:hypothetical protein n=1 Tax=Streptomyces sp. NPDC059755 TaxID=3346934 RepID=UPI0036607CC6
MIDRPVVIVVIVVSASIGSAAVGAAVIPAVGSAVVVRVAATVRITGGPVRRLVPRVRLGAGRAGRIRA